LPAETGPAPFRHIPAARQAPAPLPGQDTVQICRELLNMNPAEIQRLIDDGVLSVPADTA
jgi:crotonobetainyl-CoA:carnitine CoA-transferase CaiB-like acyl-CoA transferase